MAEPPVLFTIVMSVNSFNVLFARFMTSAFVLLSVRFTLSISFQTHTTNATSLTASSYRPTFIIRVFELLEVLRNNI